MIKEDAVMCLSSVAETSMQDFVPYYASTMQELVNYLQSDEYLGELYFEFKA